MIIHSNPVSAGSRVKHPGQLHKENHNICIEKVTNSHLLCYIERTDRMIREG